MSTPYLLGKAAWGAFKKAVGDQTTLTGDASWEEMHDDPDAQVFVNAWKEAGRAAALVHSLEEKQRTVSSGYGGILNDGTIVDRRIHPDALPIPENSLFKVPAPKPVQKPA